MRAIRAKWIGAAIIVAIVVGAGIVFSARVLQGPEIIARQFLETLLQTPDDIAALRAAAHLGDTDDPEAVIEGLSTRVVLEFLRARERQGAAHSIRVLETRAPTPQQYIAILQVAEKADRHATSLPRFKIVLKHNDDWRVTAIAVGE